MGRRPRFYRVPSPTRSPTIEAKHLARHEDPKVRRALAARNDVKPEILYFLAEDPSHPVRPAAAANTTTPGTANRKLAGVAEAVAATDDSKPSPSCWPTPAPRSARKHWTA